MKSTGIIRKVDELGRVVIPIEIRNQFNIMEKDPIEIRRIYPNPDYTGKSEYSKAGNGPGPSTSSDGEILATFEDPTKIWNNFTISGVPLAKVFERSVIIDLD